MHPYQKAPPAFAKDPWAWDYTRERMEQNTGLTYDKWEGKHFAGAAAMYKNVVKKYSAAIASGDMTMPKECIDCGQTTQHYQNDYVCKDCRQAITDAPTLKDAEATITSPGSMDELREALAKALGHDKKDAKKLAKIAHGGDTSLEGASHPYDQGSIHDMTVGPRVSRNYKAMGEDKLRRSIAELDAGVGEAIRKVKAGEDPMDHLEAALRAAQEKGVTV